MKQTLIAAMVMMTMAGSVSAETSAWDYFWGTALPEALDPVNSGWNDFWNRCTDMDTTPGQCFETMAAGTGIVLVTGIVGATAVIIAAIAATPGVSK